VVYSVDGTCVEGREILVFIGTCSVTTTLVSAFTKSDNFFLTIILCLLSLYCHCIHKK